MTRLTGYAGEEPWLGPSYMSGSDPKDPYWKLPEMERERIWWEAYHRPELKGGIHGTHRHPDLPRLKGYSR